MLMDEEFFKKIGFKKDPYSIENPAAIPFEFIDWNREDWGQTLEKIDLLLQDIGQGLSTSFKIFGGWGSGKTWLMRYIEKKAKEKLKDDVFVIYSTNSQIDSSFSTFYELLIDDLLKEEKIKDLKTKIEETVGPLSGADKITPLFRDADLARCLYEIFTTGNNKITARQWLKGNKLNSTDLKKIDAVSQNYSNLEKLKTIQNILFGLNNLFSYTIFLADELNYAAGRLGRELCDFFRQIIDLFNSKFALILAYTSQEGGDSWYDYGFTDALLSRIKYTSILTALDENSVTSFMKKHHKLYSEDAEETLHPYEEDALKHLIKSMKPENRYPRHLFVNSAILSKILVNSDKKKITKDFINENRRNIQVSAQARL